MAIYMKIDQIPGGVTAKDHEEWIALESLTFHVDRLLSTDPGRIADREGSRPAFSEIEITKLMDRSSPLIFGEASVGKAKDEVVIHVCQTDNYLNPYTEITINHVIISHYEINMQYQREEARHVRFYPLEVVRLNFDKIELRYTPYDSENRPQSPIPAGYDLRQATAI